MSVSKEAPKGKFRVIALIKALPKDKEELQGDFASLEEAKALAQKRRKFHSTKIADFFVYDDKGECVFKI